GAGRRGPSRLEELVVLVDQAVAGTELGVAVHRAQLSPFGSRPLAGPVAQAQVGPEPPVLDATADGLRGRIDAVASAPTIGGRRVEHEEHRLALPALEDGAA